MYELKIKDGSIGTFKTAAGKKFAADVRKTFEAEMKENNAQEYEITIVSNGKQQARIRVLGVICIKTPVKADGSTSHPCKRLPSGVLWCP